MRAIEKTLFFIDHGIINSLLGKKGGVYTCKTYLCFCLTRTHNHPPPTADLELALLRLAHHRRSPELRLSRYGLVFTPESKRNLPGANSRMPSANTSRPPPLPVPWEVCVGVISGGFLTHGCPKGH